MDDVEGRASQGGLLELSAACSAFRLQALVYDAERDQYIIVGKKDRQVMPLCYHDYHWSLIHHGVRLPSRAIMDDHGDDWKKFDD
eukprot:12308818-Prorocentrum_lima.AAC.1